MNRSEAIWEILKTEYGITSPKELLEAIEKQPRIDISVFCKEKEGGGK